MLLVNEIYPAICGESRFSGTPCVLVRLTGCHLRCAWCDSTHAFTGGEQLSVEAVLDRVRTLGFGTVLVTGGEPLLQAESVALMQTLLAEGYIVVLETSGTLGHDELVPLAEVPAGVHRVVDIKAPGSGIDGDLIDWPGISGLTSDDEVKIVIAGREDFTWARDVVLADGRVPAGVRTALSPAAGELEPTLLAEWILEAKLDVAFQLQLHKALWPDRERGV